MKNAPQARGSARGGEAGPRAAAVRGAGGAFFPAADDGFFASPVVRGWRVSCSLFAVHPKRWELEQRALRFARGCQTFCSPLLAKRETKRLAQRLLTAATAVDRGYRTVSTAGSRDEFIMLIAPVAKSARRARTILQDLLELRHTTIEDVRSLLLEARALEAVFRASLETARRRRKAQRAAGTGIVSGESLSQRAD